MAMYRPRANVVDDRDEIRRMVAAAGAVELVTAVAGDGPDVGPLLSATRLPVIWDEPNDRLIFHLALQNDHWREIEEAGGAGPGGAAALAIVTGPDAYVSPSWYPSKAEHGRVVPTWNYSAVHFRGRVRTHHDPAWLREAVTRLTEQNETPRSAPWHVDDAPAPFVAGQLRAIVGLEFAIGSIEAKEKLSQNRPEGDQRGVVDGLRAEGGPREGLVADRMVELQSEV